ncbi:MAG: hypothetical protein HYY99_01955 [Candidatus Colwellbacteria bacterium]|nr:hypothetical protein [Candidatus Colwellbacteria bacterium]MBI3088999.1 hypothetical protein [Candidatus Colwellbacteria bacterium]
MKAKHLFCCLAGVATVATTLFAPPALAAKPGPSPEVVIAKKCPAAKDQKVYTGRVIVYVSGNGCVSIDKGAVAIASGNATVVAHGNSVVYAKGKAVLIVFNEAVKCSVGPRVTVVYAAEDFLGAKCLPPRK